MSYIDLSASEFDTFVKAGNSVVYLWAPWCGPCITTGPVFAALSEQTPWVRFAKVNIDEHPEVAKQLGVRGVPYIAAFSDGTRQGEHIGRATRNDLETLLAPFKPSR